ncbi:flavodoxin domain-containing protein [Sporolactobacillus vineae]|uniref:flavodoxin domain-containing protein n=1 Tax=Sporolactobacillus vineae TaxID=444463 RepID=UPI0003792901|nr:flavodoxin domain-containing protein [Sporolactobacillus vineae]
MRTAIAYGTKYGSTAEVARRLKCVLGETTDLFDITKGQIPSLADYDTVIIGGSIYMGRVQKKLMAFLKVSGEALLQKKIGLYLCAAHPDPKARRDELAGAFPKQLCDHALVKDILGYALHFEKMTFLDRLIMSKVKGDKISTSAFDQEKIVAFAEAIKKSALGA